MQEVVDEVEAVVVALLQAEGQRFEGERLVEEQQLAGAGLVHRHDVVRRVVDEGVGLAVDHVHHRFLLVVVAVVLGFADQLLGDHLAGSTELGGQAVLLVVQVFVGLDLVSQLLADQQGLTDNDEGFAEVKLEVAFLGQGHAAADHVELVGQQRRDDAVVRSGNGLELDAHGLGHGLEDVDLEADDLTALVGHLERHVGRVHADTQGAALDRVIDGSGRLGGTYRDQRRDADQQHRQILLNHHQIPQQKSSNFIFGANRPTQTGARYSGRDANA
ncbi:hypothetical protein D3C80_1040390 [compost metagenome]